VRGCNYYFDDPDRDSFVSLDPTDKICAEFLMLAIKIYLLILEPHRGKI